MREPLEELIDAREDAARLRKVARGDELQVAMLPPLGTEALLVVLVEVRLRLGLRVEVRAKARVRVIRLAYLVEAVPPDDEAEEDALERRRLAHVRAADPLARLRRALVADHAEHLGFHGMRYVQNARGLYHAWRSGSKQR